MKKPEIDYLAINKESWNQRTEVHIHSEFYDNEAFKAGKSSLNEIELNLLPPLEGKSLLHLQCHFGQDTISLSKLGAKCTGVDLSDKAIYYATELAKDLDIDVSFICSDIYNLPQVHEAKYDVVFTSYGTIGWLPDINRWAKVVSHFLKPGGHFYIIDFHPVMWMFDNDFEKISYRYFNDEAIIEEENTYTDGTEGKSFQSISWNHGMAEIITSLIDKGIQIIDFQEYDYSPYNCFNKMEEVSPGKYQIEHLKGMIPMVYSIVGTK